MQGVIYFIQEDETKRIKIGKSKTASSLLERYKALQAGNSQKLKIVGLHEGYSKEERYLHLLFNHLRYRGEYFLCEQELVDYITKVNSQSSHIVNLVVSEQEMLKVFISDDYGINISNKESWREESIVLNTVQDFIDDYGFFHFEFCKAQKYFKNIKKTKIKANYNSLTKFRSLIEKEFGCASFHHVIDGKKVRFKVYGDPIAAKEYLKESFGYA